MDLSAYCMIRGIFFNGIMYMAVLSHLVIQIVLYSSSCK